MKSALALILVLAGPAWSGDPGRQPPAGKQEEPRGPALQQLDRWLEKMEAEGSLFAPPRALPADEFDRRLGELVKKFQEDPIEVRDEASGELARLVRDNLWHARERIEGMMAGLHDSEVRARLEESLKLVPPLQMRAALTAKPELGKPLSLAARIKNTSAHEVFVVRSVEGSDLGRRYPRYEISLKGPEGKEVLRPGRDSLRASGARLERDDFVRLKPGDELDPFGEGSAGHGGLKAWRPERPGTYRLKLLGDYSSDSWGSWNAIELPPQLQQRLLQLGPAMGPEGIPIPEQPGDPLFELFQQVPKMTLKAGIEFVVEEPAKPK